MALLNKPTRPDEIANQNLNFIIEYKSIRDAEYRLAEGCACRAMQARAEKEQTAIPTLLSEGNA